MKKKNSGISLIFLIIAIVIIILVTAGIFIGIVTSEQADSSDNGISPTIASSGIEIGDYVKYQGDSSNQYVLDVSKTGYIDENGTILTPTSTSWRVWDIKPNGDIVIMPTSPVNSFYLSGDTGFINSVDIIEDVCDLYTNSSLGVDENDVESLVIEYLEDTRVSSNLVTTRDNDINYGKTNADIPGNSGYKNTSHKFYTEEDGVTITKSTRIPTATNPIIVKNTYYYTNSITWNNLGSSKYTSDTYGTLLGSNTSWLASPCVHVYSSFAVFAVRYACSSYVGADRLYYSRGNSLSPSNGVRPLVSLSSTLTIKGGDGKTSSTGWEF